METRKITPSAMAFYHDEGFVPAWKQASKFAGADGRIATMLDVVDARISAGIDDYPWNSYYTTTSAEYFGYSRGGIRILIVAHGVGPMSTLQGIQKAYSFEYKDKSRNNRGGRITEQEFRDLEDGLCGEVNIVEFDPIVKRYDYPFIMHLKLSEAIAEPLLHARLGSRAEEYLYHHARMATKIHEDEHGILISDPYIVEMGSASNCFYTCGGYGPHQREYPFLDKGDGPIAHLLSTGRLGNVCHERERRAPHSILNDVSCHEWTNGVRLIGIKDGGKISNVHPGVGNISKLILKNWRVLMEKQDNPVPPTGFYALMQGTDGNYFTQYGKKGSEMDMYEPEFHISAIEPIGNPAELITTISGYHGFFRYDVKEVQALRPDGANAYEIVGDPTIIWNEGNPTHHRAEVQFYCAEVDTSKRLIRKDTLRNDFDKLMSLLS